MNKSKQRYTYHFYLAAAIIIVAYVILYYVMEQGIFSHSDYDSYTRQAAAWWQGRASLPENISWLEIAQYNGSYFISFPPFPSVVQFMLYPIFGLNTPDNLMNTLVAFATFVLVYRFLMRCDYGGLLAAVFALLMTLGSNLFYLSTTGWVWFSAQTQGFFLSVLCVFLIYSHKKMAWLVLFFFVSGVCDCMPTVSNCVYTVATIYALPKRR